MKEVLCIDKKAFFHKGLQPSIKKVWVPEVDDLFNQEVSVAAQHFANSAPHLLQVVPYITLVDTSTGEIFVYVDQVSRLCSIGLTSPVYVEPTIDRPIVEHLALASSYLCQRYLNMVVSGQLYDQFKAKYIYKGCGVIYVPGCTHTSKKIAVASFLEVDKESLIIDHQDVAKGQWMRPGNLVRHIDSANITIDPWSSMVLEVLSPPLY